MYNILERCINVERIIISDNMKSIVDSYFANNARQLYSMVDKILFKLHFVDVDKNDFYSLANEVFMYALRDYDSSKSFDGFLYSCLYKKFCTEMTRRYRKKRKADRISISIDTPIGDDENITIGDLIASDFSIDKELFEKNEEEWSKEVSIYLNNLSPLQRKIAFLLSYDNSPTEICEELHITIKHFQNSMKRILADEQIKPLRSLVERK